MLHILISSKLVKTFVKFENLGWIFVKSSLYNSNDCNLSQNRQNFCEISFQNSQKWSKFLWNWTRNVKFENFGRIFVKRTLYNLISSNIGKKSQNEHTVSRISDLAKAGKYCQRKLWPKCSPGNLLIKLKTMTNMLTKMNFEDSFTMKR